MSVCYRGTSNSYFEILKINYSLIHYEAGRHKGTKEDTFFRFRVGLFKFPKMNFDCIDLFTLSVKRERSSYFILARRISSANNFSIGVSIKTVKLRHRHVIRKNIERLTRMEKETLPYPGTSQETCLLQGIRFAARSFSQTFVLNFSTV